MNTDLKRCFLLLSAFAVALLVAASPAFAAADRYVDAVPGMNDTSGICTAAPPADGCNLDYAVGGEGAGDRIIVAPGTYNLGANLVTLDDANVELAGPGVAQATLNMSGFYGLRINALGVSVTGLRIAFSGSTSGLLVDSGADGSLVQRVSVSAGGLTAGSACRFDVDGTATLRDSVCSYTGNQSGAISVANGTSQVVNLRNVTADNAQAASVGLFATAPSGEMPTVNVRNSIINSPLSTDVVANNPGAGGLVTVNLDNSDYVDTSPTGSGVSITPPGTLNNVTGAPSFTDSVFYREAAGSPTIDKGSATFLAAPLLDIEAAARTFGSAPDIGADEFVPGPVVAPPPTVAPPSTTKCPKGRKLKKGKCVKKKKKKKK